MHCWPLILLSLLTALINCNQTIYEPRKPLKTKLVHIGQHTVIDSFEEQGNAIDMQLTYKPGYEDHPCKPKPQRVTIHQQETVNLVDGMAQEQFRAHFKEGHFNATVPELISMVQMETGAVLITNTGVIYYIRYGQEKYKVTQKVDLQLKDLEAPIFLVKSYQPNKFLIIMSLFVLEVIINPSQEESYFLQIQQSILELDPSDISSIDYYHHYLYVGIKSQKEIRIYKGIELLQIFRGIEAKALKFHGFGNETYLYVLSEGVTVYRVMFSDFNFRLVAMEEFVNIGKGGHLMDMNSNSLMVGMVSEMTTVVVDYHLDFDRKEWTELNRFVIPGAIRDIKLSDRYAIVVGTNGHYLLHHSIAGVFYSSQYDMLNAQTYTSLVIPNLQQIDLFYNQTVDLVFGLTKYSFFFANFTREPIEIVCYSDQHEHSMRAGLSMNFILNSTNCPLKSDQFDDLKMCHSEWEYKVLFTHAFISADQLVYIILGTLLITSLFIVVIAATVTTFIRYRRDSQMYESRIAALISEISKEGELNTIKANNNPQFAGIKSVTPSLITSAQIELNTNRRASNHHLLISNRQI